jgi:hypothetical protein
VKKSAHELAWGWPTIAAVLMWKLAPQGVRLQRRDLGALPIDRVLLEDRQVDRIVLTWIDLTEAQQRANRTPGIDRRGERASVEQLGGRWQKLAVALLWKLAREGVTLTSWDLAQLPLDRVLLAEGHEHDIEFRFVSRADSKRIHARELGRDHEHLIAEKLN